MATLTDPVHADAAKRLRQAGHSVDEVLHVSSTGDSGEGAETILFRGVDGALRTARILYELHWPRPRVVVSDGWCPHLTRPSASARSTGQRMPMPSRCSMPPAAS